MTIPELPPNSYSLDTCDLPNITPELVTQLLIKLDDKKSTGPDEIPK